MGNANTEPSGEDKLRGSALTGSEQKNAADHSAYDKSRNPDTVVRVDNEEDTLYSDGLEDADDTPPLGTDNAR
jgi:hypothetical protein